MATSKIVTNIVTATLWLQGVDYRSLASMLEYVRGLDLGMCAMKSCDLSVFWFCRCVSIQSQVIRACLPLKLQYTRVLIMVALLHVCDIPAECNLVTTDQTIIWREFGRLGLSWLVPVCDANLKGYLPNIRIHCSVRIDRPLQTLYRDMHMLFFNLI